VVVARKLEAETGGGLEANVVNNLATLLEDRGDLIAAESHYRRSREMRQQLFPAGHPSRAVPAHNLARLLIGLGRLDEAQVFAEEAHALRSAALRPNHALTLNTKIVLAQLALARDDEAGALRWLTPIEAAIARDTTLPATLRAAAHELRARLAQRHGQNEARVAEWRHVETDLAQLFPTAHPRMAQARLGLAEALLAAGDRAGAIALAQGAAPILRAQLAPQSPTLSRLTALERALRAER
jgi:serine/threonine-protein kinase